MVVAGELARFCSIALESASELPYHLLLARDLSLLQAKDHRQPVQQTVEVKRMLTALLQKLNADHRKLKARSGKISNIFGYA